MTRRYIHPDQLKPKEPEPHTQVPSFPDGEVDLEAVLRNSLTILQRDIKHLHLQASAGKLPPASARDLVSYVKVLSEITSAQKKLLDDASTDDLEKALNENKQDSGGQGTGAP